VPVLPAERAAPDADAAQPGHLHGIDDGDVASVLARRLQAEWRVRFLLTTLTTKTAAVLLCSVLCSLTEFKSGFP
jgi:hypothetical protein